MKVSVIIPTYNAERWLAGQLEALLRQTAEAEILVVDSGSTDRTVSIAASCGGRVRLLRIPHESFDHGGTRDWALRQSGGDYVLFLTQDALPTDARFIETLLTAFEDPHVAAAFGRQIAYPDAPEYERLTRAFNYPETGRVWSERDIARYGVKAYFLSDSASAYRRAAYEAVGGFDAPIATNEDMTIAAKFLHAGYALAYVAEASVWHSHRNTLRQEFKRNAAIGRAMEEYKPRLAGAGSGREGLRLVSFVSGNLLRRGKPGQLCVFLAHTAVRFAGFRAGRRQAGRKEKA